MEINFRDELSHDNVNNVFNCTSDLIFMICRFSPRDGGTLKPHTYKHIHKKSPLSTKSAG